MGMMTKMRDNAHVFIIAFAVVFIAFWVVSDVDLPSVLGRSGNEIGKIDGKTITYQEFQAVVDRVAEQRREQNGGKDLTDNDYIQIREQVWNDFLTQAVLDQATDEFGVTVTDQEINDWVWSSKPPHELAQYFVDSANQFNRDAYENFLRNPGPENREALISLEEQLKANLIREKLTNILSSSVLVSEEQIRANYLEQNVEFSAGFLFFDPNIIAATDTATPNDTEYEEFYNKYKNRYKRENMRKLKYVLFNLVPSKSDTTAIVDELKTYSELITQGTDFLELVEANSEIKYDSTRWFLRDQVSEQVSKIVFDLPVGSVSGPVANETGLSLFKVIAEKFSDEVLQRASHILFRTDGGQDENEQKQRSLVALDRARSGEDFAILAGELSEEAGAKERGGDLFWFGKGRMVAEFENAVQKAKVGDILGPVKTQYGWHIIKVTGRSARELRLAEISLSIRPSSRTKDELHDKARDFAYFSKENSIEEEALTHDYLLQETPEFSELNGTYVPGVGTSSGLMKFAFDNDVNDVCEPFNTGNGYVVATISEKIKAGFRPLDTELKEQIRSQVVYERQMNVTMAEAKRAMSSSRSLEQIAASNPKIHFSQTQPFFIINGAPNVGPDYAFNGTLLRLKINETSKPFRGMRGVYVVRLDSRAELDETAYKVKKAEIRKTLLQQLQNEFVQTWLEEKKKELSVVDNRDIFFR